MKDNRNTDNQALYGQYLKATHTLGRIMTLLVLLLLLAAPFAIGLFLGAVFACVLIVLPYLMTDRLRTEKDLAYSFGIPVLSTGRSNDEKKIRDTARVIQTLLKKDNSHAVFLWGSEDPASAKTREDLRQILQETCGEQVRCGDGMAEPEVINRLTETDTVVLIEKLGKSRYADIQKQLRLCGLTDCKVLGSIVLL